MKKRPSITLLTVLFTMVFAAGIGVYSSYIGMKIYQESSDHLLESFSQISETFTLFVQRNWTVLRQWDGLLKNADIDHAGSIGADMQANKESWHYSDFYLFNESTQYLTADGRRGSADSISGVFQEMYSEGGPIVSTYTASYGVPKIVFAMPLSRNMTLDGVTYTGLAVSYDTDVVDDLVDGSMYGGQSDCYIVRANGDIVLALEPQTELCEGLTNLYDLDAHADWIYGTMDDIKDCVQLGRSGSAQFTCQGGRNYLVAIPTAFPDWTLVGIILGEYGLPCSCFQFEITETVATEYSASLTRVAESLQAAGIGLCLDDFGSGYANLNTVMQLPFSVIKLDRSLLFHICTDKKAALFYQSIVAAFCRLGYRIVAEGVETQEEMELLRSWNVDMIQGYYFSRPLPPDDLLRLLTGSAETQAENQA